MRIAEIYPSLQGEGLLAGTPSVFVRTSGCNLRCVWCDTPFTSWHPEGREQSVEAILEAVGATSLRHVVVTGGEPLVSAGIAPLLSGLAAAGLHVTVETAGTVPLPPETAVDLVSLSPKLGSSAPPPDTPGNWRARHEATRRCDDVIRGLMTSPHQIKFVVEHEADFAEACRWLDDLAAGGAALDRRSVFMMPQGRTAAELAETTAWLEPACRAAGVSLAARHHIAWFGTARGT